MWIETLAFWFSHQNELVCNSVSAGLCFFRFGVWLALKSIFSCIETTGNCIELLGCKQSPGSGACLDVAAYDSRVLNITWTPLVQALRTHP